MATKALRPASMWSPFDKAAKPIEVTGTPTAATIWPSGAPVKLTSGEIGLVTITTLFVKGDAIWGLTAEPFNGAHFAAGSIPMRHTAVLTDIILPGTAIEANLYYDGAGGATETIAAADLGATVVMQQPVAGGPFCFDKETTPSTMATFQIIELIDQIGDVNGRVVAVLNGVYRATDPDTIA
jgi:hypothetical protein